VPVEKVEESVSLNESKVVALYEDIRLGGLKKLITRYIQGNQAEYENDNWKIEGVDEGKDNWTLSYKGNELIECKENYAYFSNDVIPFEDACKVAGVIEAFYGHEVDLSKYKNVD
jgi:hypothetical protein